MSLKFLIGQDVKSTWRLCELIFKGDELPKDLAVRLSQQKPLDSSLYMKICSLD